MRDQYIFIVGCARTGTTLLRQVLTKSERVCIAPETHFLRRFSRVSGRRLGWGDLRDDRNVALMVDRMFSGREAAGSVYWGWLKRNVDKQSFRERVLASDRSERAIFALLMETYAAHVKGRLTDDLILGEKTPSHLHYIPTLLEWFPGAQVVHTFRDPRAILVSELKKMRKKGRREGPKRVLPGAPARLLEPLEMPAELVHTTRSWLDAARMHTICEQRYPRNYTLLRFEDLVSEPEKQIRRICDFLNLTFEESMVREVQVVGSSFQTQHMGAAGFDQAALARWKESIHPLARAWFMLFGRKQLSQFGYEI